MSTQAQILEHYEDVFAVEQDILKTRAEQDAQWPNPHSATDTLHWIAVLGKQNGHIAEAALDRDFNRLEFEVLSAVSVGCAWLEQFKSRRRVFLGALNKEQHVSEQEEYTGGS